MRVTFLAHSGFFVELPEACLLFDWWKGTLPPIPADRPLLVFASHRHEDHFSPAIFSLDDGTRDVTFLLGRDIRLTDRSRTRWNVSDATAAHCIRLGGGEVRDLPSGVKIETLTSTDEGVAFLVTVGGHTLFHAGDLNWWHWEGEEESFNLDQATRYQHEMQQLKKTLQGKSLDLAFIPMDQRLEQDFARGVICFCESVYAKHIVPIHFWNDFDALKTMMQSLQKQDFYDRIVPVAAKGLILEDNPKRG